MACTRYSSWHFKDHLRRIIGEAQTIFNHALLMIENYRTGALWGWTRKCPYIVNGLRRAGFRGGWL